MDRYTEEQMRPLRNRWQGHEEELRALIPAIKSDLQWDESEAYRALMERLDPLPAGIEAVDGDLRGVNLSEVDLSGASLLEADLSGANLFGANLSGASLIEADLTEVNLPGVDLSEANLWGADLSRASLIESNLAGANLTSADLSGANLWGANFSGANLSEADLSGANLLGTDLSGANLWRVAYTTDEIFSRLRRSWIPRVLRWIPFVKRWVREPTAVTHFEGTDTTKVDGSKNPILKRYMEDYQFTHALKTKSWFHRRIAYPLWKISSDCGRSLVLWVWWLGVIATIFACLYRWVVVCDRLAESVGQIGQTSGGEPTFWRYLYYSLVTFTMLDFGDLFEYSESARIAVGAEVILGYVMLGGLIAIFANKLARRA